MRPSRSEPTHTFGHSPSLGVVLGIEMRLPVRKVFGGAIRRLGVQLSLQIYALVASPLFD
jgi:hypothetical protein